MLSLINIRPGKAVTQSRFDEPDSIPLPPADDDTTIYPQPLLELVYDCLKETPWGHITAEDLCLKIRENAGTCLGLKELALKLQPDPLNGQQLRCKPEPYGFWARDVD